MKFRKTNSQNVVRDLCAFAHHIERTNWTVSERKEIATWLNAKLDQYLGEDAFGTEGQCDPRGDHRS